jgi:hypothetical protein
VTVTATVSGAVMNLLLVSVPCAALGPPRCHGACSSENFPCQNYLRCGLAAADCSTQRLPPLSDAETACSRIRGTAVMTWSPVWH